jgi:hypothetical protein
VTEA